MISKLSFFKICVSAFFIYICYFLINFNIYFSKLNFSNFNLLKDFDIYLLNKQPQNEACDYNCSYNCTTQKFSTRELFEQCNTKCRCILIDDDIYEENAISSKFTIIFIILIITFFLSFQTTTTSSNQNIKSIPKISDDEFNEYKEALI